MGRNRTCPGCGYRITRKGCVQRYTTYKGKTWCVSCLMGKMDSDKLIQNLGIQKR